MCFRKTSALDGFSPVGVRQLRNRRVITLQNYDNNSLEATEQQLSASIESFVTCDTSFA